MKLRLLFIGNKFKYNETLREYILKSIEKKYDYADSMIFLKDGDNALFLHIEEELKKDGNLIIITSSKNHTTIGRVICTITEDKQILKDGVLIPSKSIVFDDRSYLFEHKGVKINVISIDEMQKLPTLLLESEQSGAIIHIFDEDESAINALMSSMAQTYDVKIELTTIIEGWVMINAIDNKYGNLSKFIAYVKSVFVKKSIVSPCISKHIIDKLSEHNKTIAFAESCTGGLLSYFFTKQNGASKVFNGSLVTYSNAMKENWLGVESATLKEYGAVSAEVVMQMSDGAMSVSSADFTISISGIAGESGGSEYKPVGTVFVGLKSKKEHIELRLNLQGDRSYIQSQSVLFAVKSLIVTNKEIFF